MSERTLDESLERPAESEKIPDVEDAASDMPSAACDGVRKAAAELIARYYYRLKEGCGNSSCDNPYCASSGKVGCLSNDEAAVTALRLFSERAKLCNSTSANKGSSSEGPLSKYQEMRAGETSNVENDTEMDLSSDGGGCSYSVTSGSNSSVGITKDYSEEERGINIDELRTTIDDCEFSEQYASLRILVRRVFSNEVALKNSFMMDKNAPRKSLIEIATKDIDSEIQSLNIRKDVSKKEDLRAAECDLDKDVDCHEESMQLGDKEMTEIENQSNNNKKYEKHFVLDICEVKQAYNVLLKCPSSEFHFTLIDACRQLLRDTLNIQFKVFPQKYAADPNLINLFIIILENPDLVTPDYSEVLGDLCWCLAELSLEQQASVVRHVASWGQTKLQRFLESMHQLLTIRLLSTHFSSDYTINDETTIISATKAMNIVYYASIYGGKWDEPLLLEIPPEECPVRDTETEHFATNKDSYCRPPSWDPLAKLLGIHPLDAREPLVELHEFYDDFLSDQLEVDRDFAYFKSAQAEKFTFLNFPFILTPATKALGLYYDNRIRMHEERRLSLYQSLIHGQATNPYLNLHIRRDHIIEDALVELEVTALDNPIDLKKQLVVEFENEQGIDEGGVSKEFFQLIIEQLFNPDYAMFVLNSETKTFWFNSTSFENDAQFTLVGIVLGLAIYNNIILDLHFPPVLYKKLCGKPGSFHDLEEWNKTIYNSLQYMLDYEENDMEEVLMQSFCVGYQDIFGASLKHNLIPQGINILVNQSNKVEFVNMYADFLLNKSVERQFFAFKKGFLMVTDDSPLMQLFRPQELELLICGSNNYDFVELKKSTEYDSGYSTSSAIIIWFWELIDQLPTEDKKLLLQFTTGSARVPVGGLARLKLTISRHGPDTDRLPTAHTCFNVLLLPEYSSKEKLKGRLLLAIKYAQGFGML